MTDNEKTTQPNNDLPEEPIDLRERKTAIIEKFNDLILEIRDFPMNSDLQKQVCIARLENIRKNFVIWGMEFHS